MLLMDDIVDIRVGVMYCLLIVFYCTGIVCDYTTLPSSENRRKSVKREASMT